MTKMLPKRAWRICAALALLISVGLPTGRADALGSGINKKIWGNAGYNLSTSLHSNSNAVGFWQTIMANWGCYPGQWVDGIFGSQTKTWTIDTQNRLNLGSLANGTVDAWTWNAAYNFITPENGTRALQFQASYAGFDFYKYFGGGAVEVQLAWSPGASQWSFEIPYFSNVWYQATSTRTMGSNWCA